MYRFSTLMSFKYTVYVARLSDGNATGDIEFLCDNEIYSAAIIDKHLPAT